jgi:hypothetical protein
MKKYHVLVIQPCGSYSYTCIEKRCYLKTLLNVYMFVHQVCLILFFIHPLLALPIILFYYKNNDK